MKMRYLTLLVLTGSLLGCGPDPKDGLREGSTPAVTFKRSSNEAKVALRTEPDGLHPLLSTQASTRFVAENIFQTLNDQHPETFEQVPLLASVPEITEEADGTVSYGYTIDPAAKWPNGLPVTAQDVVFSFKAMLNPLVEAGPYRPYYEVVANVVTTPSNERKFRVVTRRPYLLTEEALGSLWVYPEYAYDPDGLMRKVRLTDLTDAGRAERLATTQPELEQFATAFNDPAMGRDPERIVGSGPYRLVSWEEGQRITLEKRPDYWANDRTDSWVAGNPDALVFELISDAVTVGNALRDEAVDVVLNVDIEQFQNFRDDDYLRQRYDFVTVPSFTYYGILFNQNDPLVADPATRRALAHTVNVDEIIEQLFPGLAERVVGPVLASKSYFNEELQPIAYDPERARTLLAEAGWSDTNGDGTVDREIDGERRELRFQLLSSPSETSESVALLTAEGAKRAGVDIEVVKQEPRALMGELNRGNFVASIYGLGAYAGLDDFTQVWASTSAPPAGTNRGGFSSPEADQLLKQIGRSTDAKQRAALYRRFQEIVYENQPMIFLFSPSDRVAISKRFDYVTTSLAPNVELSGLTLKE